MAFILWTTVGHARNDYLENEQHCQGPTLEPYMDYSQSESMGTGTSNSGNESSGGTVGVRLRIPLTSTCSKEYIKLFNENALIKQQLELLKMCARYKNLILPDQFKDIREKCAGIKRKPEVEKEDDKR